MIDWNAVWKQLRDGQQVVLCGVRPIPEPDPAQLQLSWVECEAHPEAGGTMDAARLQIHRELGINAWMDATAQRVHSSLRRHLLGEDAEDIDAARDEHTFRHVPPGGAGPRSALVLSGLDAADAESIERLRRLFAGARRPRWPLLLQFDAREPTGAARGLLEQLERVLPREVIFEGADGGPRGVGRPLPTDAL